MIQHLYINYQDAAIAALRDYRNMALILERAQPDMEAAEARLQRPKTTSTAPSVSGGYGGDGWAAAIDDKATLQMRINDAEEYMLWLLPQWEKLTEREKAVLEERYIVRGADYWAERVNERLHIEKSAAYDICKEALEKLTRYLLWPGNPPLQAARR